MAERRLVGFNSKLKKRMLRIRTNNSNQWLFTLLKCLFRRGKYMKLCRKETRHRIRIGLLLYFVSLIKPSDHNCPYQKTMEKREMISLEQQLIKDHQGSSFVRFIHWTLEILWSDLRAPKSYNVKIPRLENDSGYFQHVPVTPNVFDKDFTFCTSGSKATWPCSYFFNTVCCRPARLRLIPKYYLKYRKTGASPSVLKQPNSILDFARLDCAKILKIRFCNETSNYDNE